MDRRAHAKQGGETTCSSALIFGLRTAYDAPRAVAVPIRVQLGWKLLRHGQHARQVEACLQLHPMRERAFDRCQSSVQTPYRDLPEIPH
jgi:hypothetical protein